MLPGPNRLGISQSDRLGCLERTHAVGDQTILRPIAATDDVAGACRCDRRAAAKEAISKTHRQEFGASLAVAVGIMAAETIAFDKGSAFTIIFIDFIAGHDEHALQLLQ